MLRLQEETFHKFSAISQRLRSSIVQYSSELKRVYVIGDFQDLPDLLLHNEDGDSPGSVDLNDLGKYIGQTEAPFFPEGR